MTPHTRESYCENILYPFIEIVRGQCTYSTCFHDPTARYAREQHNFKGHLATTFATVLHALIIIFGEQ
jgi:hypothetical protein